MKDLTEASEASEGANILKWISQTFDMFKNAKHSLQALLSGRLTEMYFWYKGSPRVLRLMSFISLQSLVGVSHIITAYRWPQPPNCPHPCRKQIVNVLLHGPPNSYLRSGIVVFFDSFSVKGVVHLDGGPCSQPDSAKSSLHRALWSSQLS